MPPPDKFLSTYVSRFDAKGRMSIPAPFRAVLRALAGDGSAALMLRPSHNHPCIEAWPPLRFDVWAERQRLENPDADEDNLAITLYSDTVTVEPDKEGRIILDDLLVQHAQLGESVTCLGLGDRFQLWDSAAAAQRKAAARQSSAPRKSVG